LDGWDYGDYLDNMQTISELTRIRRKHQREGEHPGAYTTSLNGLYCVACEMNIKDERQADDKQPIWDAIANSDA
jgi:hypothetical protein